MAPRCCRSTGITVRHGATLAHARTVDEAAALMLRLSEPIPRPLAGAQASAPPLADVAKSILGCAAELPELLCAPTVAKGLAELRRQKRRLPSTVVRDIRHLDAAGALLRHSGAAEQVVLELRRALTSSSPSTAASDSGTEPTSVGRQVAAVDAPLVQQWRGPHWRLPGSASQLSIGELRGDRDIVLEEGLATQPNSYTAIDGHDGVAGPANPPVGALEPGGTADAEAAGAAARARGRRGARRACGGGTKS